MFTAITEQFSGPLDLMLHLISEHKLDILDLDMDVLAEQYLAYLDQMQEHHLEIESEYLVELATLIEIKSKRLLPQKQKEELEEEDPRDALVRRLLEYQRYKEASTLLSESYESRQKSFAKAVDESENYGEEKEKLQGNPYDLLKAMRKVMLRLQLAKPIETQVTKREITIEERQLQLKSRLSKMKETFTFEEFIDDITSPYEFVISFLAILDLAKDRILVFSVDENEQIWFKRGMKYE